ncbi:MAG: nuclear transport factor 2 family protein [Acidimicrobiia bacterium]|nr:nuclear transport factor 2 family protein [Acidimicrobiia bacterium]
MTPDDLLEIEAIKRLKYAYLRCLDQKNWDELATLLTEDAVARYSAGKYSHDGRDAIVGWLREAMGAETFHSSHRCTHPEIELLSSDEATGVWALDDTVIETSYDVTIRGAAFYTDRYRKVDGRWLIAETGYKRSFEEIQPRDGASAPTLTASWWATGGQSSLEG